MGAGLVPFAVVKSLSTAGTIFDRSRVSLQDWFAAAWYMTNQAWSPPLRLQRLLGLGSYQTRLDPLAEARTAMVRPGRDRLFMARSRIDET